MKKCLESALNQTYNHIKVYAIIDGSPDNSVSIVKHMMKKDDRLVCVEKENGGYGSVLEYAINSIQEQYFVICDPDDWMEQNEVEVLVSRASGGLDLVVGDKYVVYQDTEEKELVSSNPQRLIQPGVVYRDTMVGKFALLSPTPHSKLYKTATLKGIVFPQKVSYSDWYLYMYCISKAKSCMYIDTPLSNYLVDREGNSTTTDCTPKSFNAHLVVYNYTISAIDRFGYYNPYMIYTLMDGYFGLRNKLEQVDCHEIKKINPEYVELMMKFKLFLRAHVKEFIKVDNINFKVKMHQIAKLML